MMLLIGKKIQRGKAGFTFIEIILTVSIILIVIGLSTPIFKSTYYDLRINLQAKDITSLMNLARERAIMTRSVYIVKLDKRNNTYRMFVLDSKKDKPIPIEGKWGRKFAIFNNLETDSSEEEIKFFPDGSSSGANIFLKDASGLKAQIDIAATTGEITIGTAQKK